MISLLQFKDDGQSGFANSHYESHTYGPDSNCMPNKDGDTEPSRSKCMQHDILCT